MKSKAMGFALLPMVLFATLVINGCKSDKVNAAAEAPPPANVVSGVDPSFFAVEHPELYPIVTATEYQAPSQMSVTGTVFPDISRTVPVISLASGRIVDIRVRLGDAVRKGQLMLRVRSDDISGGFGAYRIAVSDELLARKQLDRAKLLYEHGAIAQQDLRSHKTPRTTPRPPSIQRLSISACWAAIPAIRRELSISSPRFPA